MRPEVDPALATVVMLGVIALGWGGVHYLRSGDRQKGLLMIGCAVVVLGNLAIWTV